MKNATTFRFSLVLFFLIFYAQDQTIRYVKTVASGTGNGCSWNKASSNLQVLINASGINNKVRVGSGTYNSTTTTDRTIAFKIKNSASF